MIVLFGGRSAEHDVSCTSAVSVLQALDPSRYHIQAIAITREGAWVASDSAAALLAGGKAPRQLSTAGTAVDPGSLVPVAPLESVSADSLPPVVIPLLHGPNGEDGTMQGLLELSGLPYVGAGHLASAVAMDKGVSKTLLGSAGLPQAKWLVRAGWELTTHSHATDLLGSFGAEAAQTLGWPIFVKPANLGSSIGVSRARDLGELRTAIELALTFDDWVIVEEAIIGREIEFAVLGNESPRVSVAGEIRPSAEFYDYEDKYLASGADLVIPVELPADVLAEGQALAIKAYKTLRCEGMARVDFFLDDGSTGGTGRGWVLNEINTIPGFTPISMYPKLWEASGLSYPALVDELILLAQARHRRRSGRVGRPRDNTQINGPLESP